MVLNPNFGGLGFSDVSPCQGSRMPPVDEEVRHNIRWALASETCYYSSFLWSSTLGIWPRNLVREVPHAAKLRHNRF